MTERKHLDQYFTPQPIADALIEWYAQRYQWPEQVLEPSSGQGAFCRAVRRAFPRARLVGIDLEPTPTAVHWCHEHHAIDFEKWRPDTPFDLVTGNPPFSDAETHIRHALSLVKHGGHVAVLLRLAFMEAEKRAPFWAEHQARDVLVLRRRPSFTGGGTDSAAYGFFVFERGYKGAQTVHPCWAPPPAAEAAE